MDPTSKVSTVNFPSYSPPGTPVAAPGFQRPLYKMMKMAMRKGRSPSRTGKHKGITVTQDVHVTEKKVKWY